MRLQRFSQRPLTQHSTANTSSIRRLTTSTGLIKILAGSDERALGLRCTASALTTTATNSDPMTAAKWRSAAIVFRRAGSVQIHASNIHLALLRSKQCQVGAIESALISLWRRLRYVIRRTSFQQCLAAHFTMTVATHIYRGPKTESFSYWAPAR